MRTVFFITGCVKRRSTLTTTVFSFLSLTTVPCRMRFGMFVSLLLAGRFFGGDRLDARDVPADLLHASGLFELAGRLLEAQVELLLLQAGQFVVQLVWALCPYVRGFHGSRP